jgi:hypothetical protein
MNKMKDKKNYYWLIAGIINLFTALLHTIGGQLSLVNPLMSSNLTNQAKAEWFGAWHMVTITLFVTSYFILKNAIIEFKKRQTELIKYVGILYILFSIPSCISSVLHELLAPQWILLLPIGILLYFGTKKTNNA